MQAWIGQLRDVGISEEDALSVERVYVDAHKKRVLARFSAARVLDAGVERAIRDKLAGVFKRSGVDVRICYPALASDFMEHPGDYAHLLLEVAGRRLPEIMPFAAGITWAFENGTLFVSALTKLQQDYFKRAGLDAVLREAVERLFKLEAGVVLGCAELDAKGLIEHAERVRKEVERVYLSEIEHKPVEKPKPQMSMPLFGKPGSFSKTRTPIGELSDESGRVQIEGVVLDAETRELKGGAHTLLSFKVHDGTGTIVCKAFVKSGETAPLKRVKPGTQFLIKGDCQPDKFIEDISVTVYDMAETPRVRRMDGAAQKRVELHLHTKMSRMDGVSSASDLIGRAAEWGHKAIAITDHGVVQAFPEAAAAAAKAGIKLIYGMEGYLIEDGAGIVKNPKGRIDETVFCVLDVETTGLKAGSDRLTEIAAVKVRGGEVLDTFQTLVNPQMPISRRITELTGIDDAMVADAPLAEKAIRDFAAFAEGTVVAAHNAAFDMGFLNVDALAAGVALPGTVVDTLAFARTLLPELKSHKLGKLADHFGCAQQQYHRALSDVMATVGLLGGLLEMAKGRGCETLEALNGLSASGQQGACHVVLLAKNRTGLENLYRMVSIGHIEHYHKQPRIPKSALAKNREGILVGSACEAGELYRALLEGASDSALERVAGFYDYIEIQPTTNNAFLVRDGRVKDEDTLREMNRRLLKLGRHLGKPVVATCDVHYTDPEDAIFRAILQSGMHFEDSNEQPGLYLRTTEEMLEEFAYLGEDEAMRVVVHTPSILADSVEDFPLFPVHPEGKPTFQPVLPGADDFVRDNVERNALTAYGAPLPEIVRARVDKEMGSILGHGFATLYYSAALLSKKTHEDGYFIGSRGSVGSSLVATLLGITEINPLPAHYLCPSCTFSDFDVDRVKYECAVDLPDRACPQCGAALSKIGYDTPFEIFLGFNGDKVPDIDLNFSGEYQATAQAYVSEMFGSHAKAYRAGTVSTLASKTAYGFVVKYLEQMGQTATKAEIDRLTAGIEGVRRTTGQHPGGMVIVPEGYDIHQFTPIQYPSDDKTKGVTTTHFDFNSLHDLLVKLDILGHDDPTMLRMLARVSGVPFESVPLDDPKTMSLFLSNEALGLGAGEPVSKLGVLGLPEFGTQFVRGMLEDTKPTTMSELIRISGLSHGTGVWLGNAQELIKSGTTDLMGCICMREDMLSTMLRYGMPEKIAFNTMEAVRKGKGMTAEMEEAMALAGLPAWFVDSCRKIQYLFPKGHAAAYVMMGVRVAYYKVHHPLAYYVCYYTVRADLFDSQLLLDTPENLRAMIRNINDMKKPTAKDEKLVVLIEIVLEMYQRGIKFLPVDIYKSEAFDFVIEDGAIRPPFSSVPGLGAAAAQAMADARTDGEYLSVADLKRRARLSSAVIATLEDMGSLKGLDKQNQLSFMME